MRYKQLCPLCERHGTTSYLNTFQINFDEAVLLCENEKCTYPIGVCEYNGTVRRGIEELSATKECTPCAPAPLFLQQTAHTAAHIGHHQQKTVFGTQTGTPLSGLLLQTNRSHATSHQNGSYSNLHMQSIGIQNGFSPLTQQGNIRNGINKTNVTTTSSLLGVRPASCLNNGTIPQQQSQAMSALTSVTNGNSVTCKNSTEFPGFEFGRLKTNSKTSTPLKDTLQSIKEKKSLSSENLLKLCDKKTIIGQCNGVVPDVNDELTALCNGSKKLNGKSSDVSKCSRKVLFPQWLNRYALCWLDVTLCLLVHNASIRKLLQDRTMDKNCVIYKLIKAHNQLKSILNNVQSSEIEKSSGKQSAKRFGKSLQKSTLDQSSTLAMTNDSKELNIGLNQIINSKEVKKGQTLMDEVREEIWSQLHDKLRCEKDRPESPVFAMPLILRMDASLEKLFKMKYSFRFYCSNCQHTEENEYENTMPTFPSTVDDFTMQEPQHQRQCFRCGHKEGYRTLRYKKLPKCMLMHFVNGVPSTCWSRLQFNFRGSQYVVTGVIQYIHHPDHFIAWLRDPASNQWAECNDLGSMVCEFGDAEPQFPSEQVHILMWEKQAKEHIGAEKRFSPLRLSNMSVIKTNSTGADYNTMPSESAGFRKKAVCEICKTILDDKTCVKCGPSIKNRKNKKNDKVPFSSNTSLCSSAVESVQIKPGLTSQLDCTVYQPFGSTSTSSTPCSSLSTLSDTSVDSGILPDFTVSASQIAGVNRPVPSKLDVLGLSSLGTRTESQTQEEDTQLGKKKTTKALFSFMKRYAGKAISTTKPTATADTKSLVDKTLPPKQHYLPVSSNSAFGLPYRSKKSAMASITPTEDDEYVPTSVNRKYKTQSVTKRGRVCSDSVKYPSNSSALNTTLSVNRFKMPPYKKQNSVPNLSKDVFKSLSTDESESSMSKPPSPALTNSSNSLSNNTQYLSTVKQYLIGRTAGGTDMKPQYEGFFLKSAPGLTRRLSLPVSRSPASDTSDSKTGAKPITTEAVSCDGSSTQKSRPRKRASDSTIAAVLSKITKRDMSRELSNLGQPQSFKNGSVLTQLNNENNCKENTLGGSRNINGVDLPTTPNKLDEDCVLQDLYEALNIPFKSVPQTMSDIMVDVSDILGIADTCRLVPEQETTRTGNQTSLDCALTMTSRTQA